MSVVQEELAALFSDRFGGEAALLVTSPGRSEIAGNHTDHEGGHVIAAAIDRAVRGLFRANGTQTITLLSQGFGEVSVELDDLSARADERNSTAALVRGMAALFAEKGFAPAGFDAACVSEVLGGSGLSSSAAFELLLAQAMNALWADGALDAKELAMMSQRCEREWFGKPCGLMDQAAAALGGVQHMDFSQAGVLAATGLDFDFDEAGYALCIVSVGADHAANTDDYAAVPGEMQAVAKLLGKEILSQLSEGEVIAALPRIREELGDRAALRALHYYREERLVADRALALKAGDVDAFLALTRLSGASSAMYLQNVSVGGASDQPSMLAIALAEELLAGQGAVRVHGGGFGGTIQAFVPHALVDAFSRGMDAVFGQGACGVYKVDHEGARFAWL
ncbi:MAG: galactokinase family protein [Coriobacteriales bacterium]|nr:galactokinase family protein [Coriobacteriales bacterium]